MMNSLNDAKGNSLTAQFQIGRNFLTFEGKLSYLA